MQTMITLIVFIIFLLTCSPSPSIATLSRYQSHDSALLRSPLITRTYDEYYEDLMDYYFPSSSSQTAARKKIGDGLTEKVVFKVGDEDGDIMPVRVERIAKAAALRAGLSTPTRVFRPAGKHEAKHVESGLHLWYEATLDSSNENRYATNQRLITSLARLLSNENILVDVAAIRPEVARDSANHSTSPRSSTLSDNNSGDFPNDFYFNYQTDAFDAIHLQEAWQTATGDDEIIVSVCDSGIDDLHPDLYPNIWRNNGELCGNNIDDDDNGFTDDCHGYNFVLDTGLKLRTEDSHGTHVAGIIAAKTNNEIGVAGVAGGNGSPIGRDSGSKLMINVVFGDGSNNGGFEEAIVYSSDNGAVITNNSWGFTRPGVNDPAVTAAIDYFNANAGSQVTEDGGFVVFAAGNYGSSGAYFPGFYDGSIAVAAVDKDNIKATFSNYGSWVDISAPGLSIMSTLNTPAMYGQMSGTSMATPHVSGLLALMVSLRRGLPRQEYLDCIYETASPNNDAGYTYSQLMGKGLIDANLAIECIESSPPGSTPTFPSPPPPPSSSLDDTDNECICDHTLTITIQTDDYPDEISWKVVAVGNTFCESQTRPNSRNVAGGGPYASNADSNERNKVYTTNIPDLCPGEDYNILVFDSFGDGLCCENGAGYVEISLDGSIIRTSSTYEFLVSTLITVPENTPSCVESLSWTQWSNCDAVCDVLRLSGRDAVRKSSSQELYTVSEDKDSLKNTLAHLAVEVMSIIDNQRFGNNIELSLCDIIGIMASAGISSSFLAITIKSCADSGEYSDSSPFHAIERKLEDKYKHVNLKIMEGNSMGSISRLTEIFNRFDRNEDGHLSKTEMHVAVADLFPPKSSRIHGSVSRASIISDVSSPDSSTVSEPKATLMTSTITGIKTRRLTQNSVDSSLCGDFLTTLFAYYYENDLVNSNSESPLISRMPCQVDCVQPPSQAPEGVLFS